MTRRTNARLAGFTFLFYIAVGLTGMALDRRASNAEGTGAKLALLAEHAADVRTAAVLTVVMGFCALVLAVTLHALTRDEDSELARLAMFCRVGEGLVGLAGIPPSLGLLKLATAVAASGGGDPGTNAVGGYLLSVGDGNALVCSILFAAGSTLFCYLFLRARTLPAGLAWLGVAASVLLLIALPAQLGGVLAGPATGYVWMPMLLFEVAFAVWLMVKGVAEPSTR
jgi:hypothetical protein